MRIGVPREVKNHEYRVALTPAGVHELTRSGHQVLVERGAGLGSSITDADFAAAGARIVGTADEVWAAARAGAQGQGADRAGVPPAAPRPGAVHLPAPGGDRPCTEALLAAGTTAIAYETVQLPDGSLPLLAPMSEVAGRLAPAGRARTP